MAFVHRLRAHHGTRSLQSWLLVAVAATTGCGDELERVSEVTTLRVLAVRAEIPFSRPGSRVKLSLLSWDGSPDAPGADGTRRRVTTLWLGGCTNPPGDSYQACMPYLHQMLDELGEQVLTEQRLPAGAPEGLVGWGDTFEADVRRDTIASRPVATGVFHPYGVQMVFVVTCAGVLHRIQARANEFPLGCFDPDTGDELGRDDFDFGYYPLFVYETLENQNPTLSHIAFSGLDPGPECSGEAPCPEGSRCGSSAVCLPIVARCKAKDEEDCPRYELDISVSRASAELAVVAHVPEADAVTEGLWVNYYSTGGSWQQQARTIHDPHSGWAESIDGKWRANAPHGSEVKLWAVVRDTRNGVTWDSVDVWVD